VQRRLRHLLTDCVLLAWPHAPNQPTCSPPPPPVGVTPGKKKLFERLEEDWRTKERLEEEERLVKYRATIEAKLVPVSDIMSGKVKVRPQGSASLDIASPQPLGTQASLGKSADGLMRLVAEAAGSPKAGGSPKRGGRGGPSHAGAVTLRKSLAMPRKKPGGRRRALGLPPPSPMPCTRAVCGLREGDASHGRRWPRSPVILAAFRPLSGGRPCWCGSLTAA
jgi:hypothetical protein